MSIGVDGEGDNPHLPGAAYAVPLADEAPEEIRLPRRRHPSDLRSFRCLALTLTRSDPDRNMHRFTTLLHHIDVDLLEQAYHRYYRLDVRVAGGWRRAPAAVQEGHGPTGHLPVTREI
jgi:hypothetical protein